MDSLAIVICATHSFQYALLPQARAIQQNVAVAGVASGHIILVTDEKPVDAILERYAALLPAWEIHHVAIAVKQLNKKDYSANAQLLIAQLYSAAFDKARALGVDSVWTLEADVIPEPNNLRSMRDTLAFDGGYYDVAFCPYISAGGGGIMGGRGSEREWIAKNWTPEETKVPEDLQTQIEAHKARLGEGEPSAEWKKEAQEIAEKLKQCPPKGNVFTLNGERWRQRGWLEWAYPAVGKGAILPSDWLPMGNNLFSARALQYVDFTSYTGRGTQDLFLTYLRLAPNGLKFAVIPHSPSSHVVRKKNADGGDYTLYRLYHEQQGECVGHLRHSEHPFYTFEAGERLPEGEAGSDYSI